MEEINITDQDIEYAVKKSLKMGNLRNSITNGEGNVCGFIGEKIICDKLKAIPRNTYDYDMILRTNGSKIDVKTKRTTVRPRKEYVVTVWAGNINQKCDFYAFVRVDLPAKIAYILGYYPKELYFKDSTFHRKGDIDISNNFKFSSDCFNMAIKKLKTNPE